MALRILRPASFNQQILCQKFLRAGEKYRESLGKGRSGNEDGPLHDLPDFRYPDGRLAPVSSKQVKWMKKRIYIKTKIEAIQKQMDTRAKHKGAYGI